MLEANVLSGDAPPGPVQIIPADPRRQLPHLHRVTRYLFEQIEPCFVSKEPLVHRNGAVEGPHNSILYEPPQNKKTGAQYCTKSDTEKRLDKTTLACRQCDIAPIVFFYLFCHDVCTIGDLLHRIITTLLKFKFAF